VWRSLTPPPCLFTCDVIGSVVVCPSDRLTTDTNDFNYFDFHSVYVQLNMNLWS